jgi:hypothetical protein
MIDDCDCAWCEAERRGRLRVWRGHCDGDWFMTCVAHNETLTTYSWEAAYEAALGHAVMHHPIETPCDEPAGGSGHDTYTNAEAQAWFEGRQVGRAEGPGRVENGNLVHTEFCEWLIGPDCTCGIDAAFRLGYDHARADVAAAVEVPVAEMHVALARIVFAADADRSGDA